jgi:hypothetical protein
VLAFLRRTTSSLQQERLGAHHSAEMDGRVFVLTLALFGSLDLTKWASLGNGTDCPDAVTSVDGEGNSANSEVMNATDIFAAAS